MKKYTGIILALSAGITWGLMGYFVRNLSGMGLGSMEIGEIRIFFALLATGVYLSTSNRKLFRMNIKDIWCFIGSGVFSVMLFCYTNFKAMEYIPISVATILVYTSPIFVTFMSAILFKERITLKIVIALALSFGGCILVSGLGGGGNLSTIGIVLGLVSGFIWALYTIFSRFAINRGYGAWTITFYSFLFCVVVGAFFCDWKSIFRVLSVPANLPYAIGLGLCCGFAPYVLFGKSLERIPGSFAAVLSSVEPVVATLISILVFHEPFGIMSVFGIILVLTSVIILSFNGNQQT